MKGIRTISIIMTAAACALAAKGEDHYVPHISVGIHGGMDASRVTFSPSIRQLWSPGSTFGISARYAEEKLVGIVAEVNYTQRGWKEDFQESPLSYSRHLHYITVPVMTHVYFGPHRCKCFFNIGPEFGLLLEQSTSANFDINNPNGQPDWPEDPRNTEQLTKEVKNAFDYGICAGVGCEYWLRPRHSMYVELRYYYGLGNIFPATKADTFGASRNMTIGATIGYNFRVY